MTATAQSMLNHDDVNVHAYITRNPGPYAGEAIAMVAGEDKTADPREWFYGRGIMTWRRVYPGRLDQVAIARRFPAFLLADTAREDDALLITTELVSNALVHTRSGQPGGWFSVEVTRGSLARIAVHDLGGGQVPQIPQLLNQPPQQGGGLPAEHGYGLHTVAQLAVQLGVEGDAESGHTVWAQLDFTRPSPSKAPPPFPWPDLDV